MYVYMSGLHELGIVSLTKIIDSKEWNDSLLHSMWFGEEEGMAISRASENLPLFSSLSSVGVGGGGAGHIIKP